MPDERTTIEKLEAMANQTASPEEADVARSMLAAMRSRLAGSGARPKSARVLGREDVMAAPDRDFGGVRRGVRVRFPSGTWMHMYQDEVDWELVETHRMPYRWDDDLTHTITPPAGVRPNRRAQI